MDEEKHRLRRTPKAGSGTKSVVARDLKPTGEGLHYLDLKSVAEQRSPADLKAIDERRRPVDYKSHWGIGD